MIKLKGLSAQVADEALQPIIDTEVFRNIPAGTMQKMNRLTEILLKKNNGAYLKNSELEILEKEMTSIKEELKILGITQDIREKVIEAKQANFISMIDAIKNLGGIFSKMWADGRIDLNEAAQGKLFLSVKFMEAVSVIQQTNVSWIYNIYGKSFTLALFKLINNDIRLLINFLNDPNQVDRFNEYLDRLDKANFRKQLPNLGRVNQKSTISFGGTTSENDTIVGIDTYNLTLKNLFSDSKLKDTFAALAVITSHLDAEQGNELQSPNDRIEYVDIKAGPRTIELVANHPFMKPIISRVQPLVSRVQKLPKYIQYGVPSIIIILIASRVLDSKTNQEIYEALDSDELALQIVKLDPAEVQKLSQVGTSLDSAKILFMGGSHPRLSSMRKDLAAGDQLTEAETETGAQLLLDMNKEIGYPYATTTNGVRDLKSGGQGAGLTLPKSEVKVNKK